MKNTQLRRGNKVLHNGNEKTVDCISPGYVNFIEDKPNTEGFGKWVDLDEVEFIPLSENHLFGRGFEKGGLDNRYFIKPNSGFFLGISLNGTLYFMFNEDNIMPVKCKFYHQLQNIFFALTGKELELLPGN